ncbi:aromatic compound dioxygenase [Punctularia strigosozonata HHB-11173 SS5]|uniref:aromatic compound dioxygenase n=1 Tax=Punctularia strigosozonata (strain HHB-11173) TaxID=741275 RepID=UPI000441780B|nr:aromatic compound dioxygenase [Punctularia strigosozonata HHB-11173 SS5]EIN08539.1 aromatic compound dioxygenase [Punctularia strigosozonata HHB-11173 SS5]
MADPAAPPVNKALSNGIPPPAFDLPYPERPETITNNILKLTEHAPDARSRFVFTNLIKHLHAFVEETSLTTAEWMTAIQFLTRVGKTCTDLRQECILLSDVLGVSALVDAINNPPQGGATESSVLGPFFTEDAPDVELGGTIASEGKGQYMYVEGRVLNTKGEPIPDAVIETWETDELGFYDTQYKDREQPDCRGRLRSDKEGKYGYRAIVPVAYPIPGDGPVGELLVHLGRHNMRPNHLHLMVTAPGYTKLITALYPEGDVYLESDAVFGVKKSLVVSYKDVNDDAEARARGFPQGGAFKLLQFDIVLTTEEETRVGRELWAKEHGVKAAAESVARI